MDSDTEYVELTKPVTKRSPRQDQSTWTLLLLMMMLLVAIALIVLPPVLAKPADSKLPLEIAPSDQSLKSAGAGGLYPTVTLKHYGDIRGVYENGVRAFHGVPFAEPPTEDLRWRPPHPKKPWHPKILDTMKKKAACLQNYINILPENWVSEDCLYLEIYAPIDIEASPPNLPVMFYIHGGAYENYGARDRLYDGSSLVRRTGAIVVVTEYRLGAMGFLVHGTKKNIQGNYGLLDQVFALEWVHKNIAAFGGDPHKVTLVGQSAGAQSAIIHMMSKKTSKLFISIILESPPVPLPVKTYSQGLSQTMLLSHSVKCPGEISMECLRKVSGQAILDAQKMSRSFGEMFLDRPEPWGPVVDKKLIYGPLLNGFKGGENVPRKPIMWGVTSEEALLFVGMISARPSGYLMYAYAKVVFQKLGVDPNKLGRLYPVDYKDSRTSISKMLTDFLFRCPAEWAIAQFAKYVPTIWTYVFEKTVYVPPRRPLSVCSNHACHSINIPYVFNTFDVFNVSITEEDKTVSKSIDYYYGNFLWFGNPNGKDGSGEQSRKAHNMPFWPRSYENEDSLQNMVFQGDGSLDIGGGVRKDKCEFWNKKYP